MSRGMKNRIKKLEAEALPEKEYSRVVILYEGETEDDADRKFVEQNGGERPPPEIDGHEYIIINAYCDKPAEDKTNVK